MAKDIQWMGAIFPDVPSITLPQQGGGLASFDDTSDGNIQPADVAQGKIGYAQGQRVVGTAVAPTGSQTFTENGTYDVTALAEAVINVAGGGGSGLEYETGTWSTTGTITQPTINFSKTHSSVPIFAMIVDVTGAHSDTNAVLAWVYAGWFTLFGTATYSTESNPRYGEVVCAYRGSTASISSTAFALTTSPDDSASSGTTNTRYWINESAMKPGQGSVSRVFYPNHTYKWIAIWAPTT